MAESLSSQMCRPLRIHNAKPLLSSLLMLLPADLMKAMGFSKMVDNSSFAYLLSTPNSRVKIIATQGVYALASVAMLFAALFGVGVLVCSVMFPNTLDIGAFFSLNFTTMLVNMVIMMISFFFSCLFNETRLSLGFGASIPIAFIFMNMLGAASAKMEFLKKLSIYLQKVCLIIETTAFQQICLQEKVCKKNFLKIIIYTFF